MSGICGRGFMLKKFGILGVLSELLEPHLFGRTDALKFAWTYMEKFREVFVPKKIRVECPSFWLKI